MEDQRFLYLPGKYLPLEVTEGLARGRSNAPFNGMAADFQLARKIKKLGRRSRLEPLLIRTYRPPPSYAMLPLLDDYRQKRWEY